MSAAFDTSSENLTRLAKEMIGSEPDPTNYQLFETARSMDGKKDKLGAQFKAPRL